MAMPSAYKPSPLGYGSPRSSPFRRQESPASPTPIRQTTPNGSPTKSGASYAPNRLPSTPGPTDNTLTPESRTPRGRSPGHTTTMPPISPRLGSPAHLSTPSRPAPARVQSTSGNALSQLQPTQVRTLRDAFQILDRDSDGVVNREDVADMLGQLGLPTTPSDLAAFFPPGEAPTMTLAVFLNSIAASLALMSPSAELLSALSAFDDDDSGQVDLGELREALLHTPPEEADIIGGAAPPPLTPAEVNKIVRDFSGRRAFSKHAVAATSSSGGGGAAARRGEVFRYRDFVNSIVGGGGSAEANANGHAEEE